MTENSKPEHPLRVILDIPSLQNKDSGLIQCYEDNEFFEFVAVGGSSKFTELQIDFENRCLWLEKDHLVKRTREEWGFLYTEEMFTKLAEGRDLKIDEVKLLYFTKTLAFDRKRKVILVTQRKKLLNYASYVSEKLPNFTIFCPEEARVFIDLFCKRFGKYFLKPHHVANRGLWYLYSVKSKLPQFQLAWSIYAYSQAPSVNAEDMEMMGSISHRMRDMLKAIDEIGMNYYKGSNNDTMDDMLYHFNYWITLYCGILDALAWISLYRYGIPIQNKNKVALGSKDILAEIYKANPKLKEVISRNRKVIDLVYEPRHLFIHREMLHGLRLSDHQAGYELNMLDIEGEFLSHVRALQPVVERGLNKAGLYKINGHERYLLEPYRFVKFATKGFIAFLNQYVSALEYEQILIEDQALKKKVEEATKTTPQLLGFDSKEFQDFTLGY